MKLRRRTFLSLLAGATAVPAGPLTRASADTYPSRPIHLVVGFTPGAASDVIGRLFAQGAGPLVGQQIVVENKPGAGSIIAAQYVARAAKDGYTLFLPALSTLTNQIINPAPALDLNRDFAPIALLAIGAVVLVVNPSSNVHTVAELIALAKSKPGQVLYGSTGQGSLPQLAAELFAQRAGVKLTHVPYPGSPQIAEDLLAGRITMSFTIASSVIGQIAAGQIIALATAATKRPSALPSVPTMAEAGMPDFDTGLWLGLAAPVGAPRQAVETMAAAARKAMHASQALKSLRKQAYDPLDAGPDEFAEFLRKETLRWTAVARAAGMKR
jgi:tripartite-type tricarboxylate transporter receptor subunit TctC